MGYKYQMHVHTYPASDCGVMTPSELVEELYSGGYSGCVLTNHFYWGNTGVDRNLPWADFVDRFTEDYRLAVETAKRFDLDILFGLEEHVGEGKEILCYGVTPEILTAHPELREIGLQNWHSVMSSCGAMCIQAHPFRERAYIPSPGMLDTGFIDGVEVFNAANREEENEKAEGVATADPQLIAVSGADAHTVSAACIGGIETKRRIRTVEELVRVLRLGDYKVLK